VKKCPIGAEPAANHFIKLVQLLFSSGTGKHRQPFLNSFVKKSDVYRQQL
jgi:hypothetical protein